ncbi:hypothetical protein HNP67_001327, partial [Borreliella californiensis]|nr:hypothetical protein [Borreliella californiensis]
LKDKKDDKYTKILAALSEAANKIKSAAMAIHLAML